MYLLNKKYLSQFVFIQFFALFLSGCMVHTTPNGPYQAQHGVHLPGSSNGYSGKLAAEPFTDPRSAMAQACRNYGGLDYQTVLKEESSTLGWNFWSYKCNAAKPTVFITQPSLIQSSPTSSSQTGLSAGFDGSGMSIEEAKSKCTDLGFKSATEKFGLCVLQLTK